ncbi:MAG: M28 family peptidase [bacterium]
MTRLLSPLIVLALAATALAAPAAPVLPASSPTLAFQHVAVLSQQIGPRPAGSANDARGADYIADQFRRLGYAVERQQFPFRYFEETQAPSLTVLTPAQGPIRLITLEFSASTAPDGLEAELVAAGLGRPQDLSGTRLDGRIALVERGQIQFREKAANVAAAGGAAVIVYNTQGGPVAATLVEPSRIPAVIIGQDDGQRLAELLKTGTVRVRLGVRTIVEQRMTENVIGIKRGTTAPNEIVVVGGHRDSVRVSPGANDNGTGTAAVLETARLLAGVPTARTIHFIGFGAEEVGLLGSAFYVKNATAPIAGMVNMDMVGRGPGIMAGNQTGQPLMLDIAETVARRLDTPLRRFRLGQSDHVPFEQAGIPAVFLHTGDDDAIHTPNDTLDRVSGQLIATAASLAAGIALEVANRR